jgi:hypothetical protein
MESWLGYGDAWLGFNEGPDARMAFPLHLQNSKGINTNIKDGTQC